MIIWVQVGIERGRKEAFGCQVELWTSVVWKTHMMELMLTILTHWDWQKGCQFFNNIFRCIILRVWTCMYFAYLTLKFHFLLSNVPINNKPQLFKIEAWCRTRIKSLSEPLLAWGVYASTFIGWLTYSINYFACSSRQFYFGQIRITYDIWSLLGGVTWNTTWQMLLTQIYNSYLTRSLNMFYLWPVQLLPMFQQEMYQILRRSE